MLLNLSDYFSSIALFFINIISIQYTELVLTLLSPILECFYYFLIFLTWKFLIFVFLVEIGGFSVFESYMSM